MAHIQKFKFIWFNISRRKFSISSYAFDQSGYEEKIIASSKLINEKIIKKASELNIDLNVGRIHCSDVFYKDNNPFKEMYEKQKCLAVEMETFALFHNAKTLNKEAACILTVSDNLETKEETTSAERQTSFTKMIELALESIL